ncbi:MAG: hypothetical protein QGM50_01105 [Anaerolineae bacterium]|nr:hypothetical protein [Anaerolineae bacterium]MDK1117365.1 hypothetical protein [Anaerolineae bacterium]
MDALKKFSQFFGLHPLVGFGMFAVDLMMFGAETATLGFGWIVTASVAAFLSIPSILIQRFSYKDDWGSAVGKGLLVGVLTAIPTALPAAVPFIGGILGTVNVLTPDKPDKPIDVTPTPVSEE